METLKKGFALKNFTKYQRAACWYKERPKMSKKYYIELESLTSGKYYRDDHGSKFPTFKKLSEAHLWSYKDYSDYFLKKKKSAKYHIISEEKMKDYNPITKEEATLCYNGDSGDW